MRTEHLLTNTSDSGHGAAQGNLARETHGRGYDTTREKRNEGENNRDTSRRAILLHRSRGKVKLIGQHSTLAITHVNVIVAERVVADTKLGRMSLDPGHRELRRFLDDVAELTREAQMALPVGDQCALDEQDASIARSHVSETGDDSGAAALLAHLVIILGHPENALDIIDCDDGVVRRAAIAGGGILDSLGAAKLCDLPLEGTHPSLASIIVNDTGEHVVVGRDTALAETVLLRLLGEQEATSDRELLVGDVAGALNHLASVEERAGDGVEAVGSRDKRHLAEVDCDVTQVVVVEGPVLRGVERFEQSGGGVAMVVGLTDLVNLVN